MAEYPHNQLTEKVIGAAIKVHRALGPGLLESAYEVCLADEMDRREIAFRKQVALPVEFEGRRLDCGYRMDFVIDDRVVLELKCVEQLLPIHSAQLLTYLKLSGHLVGLLLNFNAVRLRDGIVRHVNTKSQSLSAPSAPLR